MKNIAYLCTQKTKPKYEPAMKTQNDTENVMKIVAYYRVSTKRQSLGLDAQQRTVEGFASEKGATIIATFSEKESGKLNEFERPRLNIAMATARKHNAILVVAKADRLSRDMSYAARIVFNEGIKVRALNMTEEAMSDPLLFGVYWGLANTEANMISQRTKDALQALKDKGVKLGRPDAATCLTDEIREKASKARTRKAETNENNIQSMTEIKTYLATDGKRTLQAIADHLTVMGCLTSRGRIHSPQSVKLLCQRYGIRIK